MKKSLRAFVALALAIAGPVLAGNGVNTISISGFESNLTSIAVKVIVTGDDDTNTVVRLFLRDFGSGFGYDSGQVMVRRVGFGPTGTNLANCGSVYEGRLMWLNPGELVQFYAEANDPTSGITSTAPSTAVPAPIPQIDATGPVFYVNANTGDDNNDGTIARPKLTINAALIALGASTNNGKHGGIFLQPGGEWHERFDFDSAKFPSDGGPWFIEGYPGCADTTIICGANPWIEKGLWAPGKPIKWVYTGQDSTWKAYLPGALGGSSPGDSCQLAVLGFGEMLHRKTSIRAILDDSTYAYVFASPGGIGSGELSGWYWQNDTMYVKRRNGRSPAGMPLHFGYLDALVQIKRQNVRIANLTMRYAGGVQAVSLDGTRHLADVNPSENGIGVLGGIGGTATGLVVDSCRFYGFNSAAVYMVKGAGGFVTDKAVLANSIIDNLRLGDFNYGACKSRVEEGAGQVLFRTRGGIMCNNVIRNQFNGLGIDGATTDSTEGMNTEIVFNRFEKLTDDAMEFDAGHQLNLLVLGDTTIDTNTGISICGLWDGGPLFVYDNLFVNYRAFGVKGCGDNAGIVHFVHNTFASNVTGTPAVNYAPGGGVEQTTFVNNAMSCKNGFALIIGPAAGGSATNSFNFDALEANGTTTFLQWNGVNYTFAQAQSILGWEKNGTGAGVGYVDTTRANWSLRSSAPALNTGRRWTGLNTMIGGIRYSGSAPDKGAIERVQP